MNEDSNRPSFQSERSFEHPFHYGCCSYSVFPRVFFFCLSDPFCPIYVWSAKTTSKSLRSRFEIVNETGIAMGVSTSFYAVGTVLIGSPPRNRPDTICPGILADCATGLICTSNNESWVQTASVVAHDLPLGSDSYRVSVLGGGSANSTLSQLHHLRENVNIHFHLVRNRDFWSQSDGDKTSILLLEENEVHRAPSPLTVRETFGLLKGKVCVTYVSKNHIRTVEV